MIAGAGGTGRAEHSRVPIVVKPWPHGQLAPVVRYGVPDDELTTSPVHAAEEDAAVAGVERAPFAAVGMARAEGAGGDEAGQVDAV